MKIILKAKNEKAIKGFKLMEKQSKGLLLKRLIKTTWLEDDYSTIQIMSADGTQMQKGRKAKEETQNRLMLYLSTVCNLKKEDYEVL